MGVLEAFARVVQLGGRPERAGRVAELRRSFEERTGAFSPDDDWFEVRSRAFWCDTVTREGFGQEIDPELGNEERTWLSAFRSAHRGLFRVERNRLVDVWSGAELEPTLADEESTAELAASAGQLFDGRVVGVDRPLRVALLPGAVFHPREATVAIEPVLAEARARGLSTHDTLDALLRMERMLRSLSRVKAGFAYRRESLSRPTAAPLRRAAKSST
ncbi:MAG: hypothetical protein M3O50_04135 [Myxococcota bacterium]|nr:hypothetical protein [Myxococcota bacterium]